MTTVAILHPGQMGTAVGLALMATGHQVFWCPVGRTAQTVRRADDAGFTPVDDVRDCDLVLSVCPPHAAVSTRQVSGRIHRHLR